MSEKHQDGPDRKKVKKEKSQDLPDFLFLDGLLYKKKGKRGRPPKAGLHQKKYTTEFVPVNHAANKVAHSEMLRIFNEEPSRISFEKKEASKIIEQTSEPHTSQFQVDRPSEYQIIPYQGKFSTTPRVPFSSLAPPLSIFNNEINISSINIFVPPPDIYWSTLKSQLMSYTGAEDNTSLTPYVGQRSGTEEVQSPHVEQLPDIQHPDEVQQPEDVQQPPEHEKPKLQYFVDDAKFPAKEEIIDGKKLFIWKGPKNTADIVLASKLGPLLTEEEIRQVKSEIGEEHRRGVGDNLRPNKRHRFDESEIQEVRPPRHIPPDLIYPHSCWLPGGFRRTISKNFKKSSGGGLEPGVSYTDGHARSNNISAWKKIVNKKLLHPLPLFLIDFCPNRCYCKM